MKKFLMLYVIAMLLIFAGCTPVQSDVQPTYTKPADSQSAQGSTISTEEDQSEAGAQPGEDASTQDDSAEPQPAATMTPVPRPTSSASVCVEPSDHEPLSLMTYAEFPQVIMDYLNDGASPEELAVELIVNQLSPDEQPVWAEDLTQDGVRDVVVTVLDPEDQRQGALMIYTCSGSEYVLSHIVVSPQDYYAPKLLYIQDMTDDGLREVIYSSTTCFANTCYEDIQIISWANGVFMPHLEGSTVELPGPDAKLTDYDKDGVYDLEVVGKIVSDVAAGPQRNTINVWAYDPASGNWKLTEQSLASSPFRIHMVHDAEDAMDRAEYLIAALLFEQVGTDENLLDWSNPSDEYNNLTAYATYKRIVAHAYLEDRPAALALYDEFVDEYGNTEQYGYVEMADAFLTDSEVLGLEGGCTSARQYAAANQFLVLTPLGSSVYGYTNRDFTAEDICP